MESRASLARGIGVGILLVSVFMGLGYKIATDTWSPAVFIGLIMAVICSAIVGSEVGRAAGDQWRKALYIASITCYLGSALTLCWVMLSDSPSGGYRIWEFLVVPAVPFAIATAIAYVPAQEWSRSGRRNRTAWLLLIAFLLGYGLIELPARVSVKRRTMREAEQAAKSVGVVLPSDATWRTELKNGFLNDSRRARGRSKSLAINSYASRSGLNMITFRGRSRVTHVRNEIDVRRALASSAMAGFERAIGKKLKMAKSDNHWTTSGHAPDGVLEVYQGGCGCCPLPGKWQPGTVLTVFPDGEIELFIGPTANGRKLDGPECRP